MLDSLGLCIFVAFPVLDIPDALVAIHEMLEAHTGHAYDIDALMQMGKEVLTMERMYNTRAGFTAADDRLPQFMLDEPLPPHDVVFTVTDADLDTLYDFVPETATAMGLGRGAGSVSVGGPETLDGMLDDASKVADSQQ